MPTKKAVKASKTYDETAQLMVTGLATAITQATGSKNEATFCRPST